VRLPKNLEVGLGPNAANLGECIQDHFALSALSSFKYTTWADGPGYYISRPWR
jgi:hypothetical protein